MPESRGSGKEYPLLPLPRAQSAHALPRERRVNSVPLEGRGLAAGGRTRPIRPGDPGRRRDRPDTRNRGQDRVAPGGISGALD